MFQHVDFGLNKDTTTADCLAEIKLLADSLNVMCTDEPVTLQAFNVDSAYTFLKGLKDGLAKFKLAHEKEQQLKASPIAPTTYQFASGEILKDLSFVNARKLTARCPIGFKGSFDSFAVMLDSNVKAVTTFQETLGVPILKESARLLNTPAELSKLNHTFSEAAKATGYLQLEKAISAFFTVRTESSTHVQDLYSSLSEVTACDKKMLKFYGDAGKFKKGEELVDLISQITHVIDAIVENNKLDPVKYATNRKVIADMATGIYNLARWATVWTLYMAKANAFIHALETNQAEYLKVTSKKMRLVSFLPGSTIINTMRR